MTVTLGDVTIADQQVPADSYGRLGIDVTRGRLSIRDWRALRRDSGDDPREFVALNPDLALSNASRRAVSEPRLLHEVKPQYTRDAMEAKIEGQVELDAIVERDGSVTGVRVIKPLDKGLDQHAIYAVSQWRFAPATLNGQPVRLRIDVFMDFTLR